MRLLCTTLALITSVSIFAKDIREASGRPVAISDATIEGNNLIVEFTAFGDMNACFNRKGKNAPFISINGKDFTQLGEFHNISTCPKKRAISAGESFSLVFNNVGSEINQFQFYEGQCGKNKVKGCWSFLNVPVKQNTNNDIAHAAYSSKLIDEYYERAQYHMNHYLYNTHLNSKNNNLQPIKLLPYEEQIASLYNAFTTKLGSTNPDCFINYYKSELKDFKNSKQDWQQQIAFIIDHCDGKDAIPSYEQVFASTDLVEGNIRELFKRKEIGCSIATRLATNALHQKRFSQKELQQWQKNYGECSIDLEASLSLPNKEKIEYPPLLSNIIKKANLLRNRASAKYWELNYHHIL